MWYKTNTLALKKILYHSYFIGPHLAKTTPLVSFWFLSWSSRKTQSWKNGYFLQTCIDNTWTFQNLFYCWINFTDTECHDASRVASIPVQKPLTGFHTARLI